MLWLSNGFVNVSNNYYKQRQVNSVYCVVYNWFNILWFSNHAYVNIGL